MKRNLKVTLILLLSCLSIEMFSSALADGSKVLCTTFPVYQITRNLTRGIDGIDVDLMIPAGLGCPHNYSLTPGDMRKVAAAEILVINGLGMEEFLGAPIERANPEIAVIDSSVNIGDLIQYGRDHSDGAEASREDDHESAAGHHGHGHDHGEINPHLFSSPRMAGKMALNIADGLARRFPDEAGLLRSNGKSYSERMTSLAGELSSLASRLENKRIVTQHGAFDYLARDAGLEIVGVINVHGGDSLSASGIISLVKKIRKEKVGAVFTEPQYSARIGRTIAAEAGIPSGELDPVASGPENAPLDYYESVMRNNMKTLHELLGDGN